MQPIAFAQLTRQLLAVNRQTMQEMKVLDLNHQIGEAEDDAKVIGEDVKLAVRADVELDRIRADSGQIHQVLLNLILNARDAMPRVLKPIETANVESEMAPEPVIHQPTVRPPRPIDSGRYRLRNGSRKSQAPDFRAVLSTKAAWKGTGLGLQSSGARHHIQQGGGRIEVDSAPGQGSAFNVYFPAVAEQVPAVATSLSNRREGLSGTETLLLVEDEDAVRTTSMMALQT